MEGSRLRHAGGERERAGREGQWMTYRHVQEEQSNNEEEARRAEYIIISFFFSFLLLLIDHAKLIKKRKAVRVAALLSECARPLEYICM